MNVFEAVKQSVTTRQAAEHYGIHVGRNGMACCPFHNDKTPSMKLDQRYHCFGCGADGLGTPATRAGIIEGLILKGLVERKDKNLIPTKKGISLITIVCDFLKSEDITSQWESKLHDIFKGKFKEEEFLNLIINEIQSIISMYGHVKI